MNFEQNDLLGHPLAVPSPDLKQALGSPDLLQRLACARLMLVLSPLLRGDGVAGGWSSLMDGIPAVFPLGVDHNLRRANAALAGLIDDPVLEMLDISRPTVSEIRMEMRRIAKDAAIRFESAAARLRAMGDAANE